MRLILAILLLFSISSANNSEINFKEIPANIVVDSINRGEPVNYNHVNISGSLVLVNNNISTPISITDSIIYGSVNFSHKNFKEIIDFSGTDFRHIANFAGSNFYKQAKFHKCTFGANIFDKSDFLSDAEFNGATFLVNANFFGCQFNDASFGKDNFYKDAQFEGSIFKRTTDFNNAHFDGTANFRNITSTGILYFIQTKFSGSADFKNSRYYKESRFFSNFLNKTDFSHGNFGNNAIFTGSIFSKTVTFDNSNFENEADFNEVQFLEDTSFKDCNFKMYANFSKSAFNNGTFYVGEETTFNKLNLVKSNIKKINQYIRWNHVNSLTLDIPSYNIFLENYKTLRLFDDQNDCYYSFKRDSFFQEPLSLSKLWNFFQWISFGFGLKPA